MARLLTLNFARAAMKKAMQERTLSCMHGLSCFYTVLHRGKTLKSALATMLSTKELKQASQARVCTIKGCLNAGIIDVNLGEYDKLAMLVFQDSKVCTARRYKHPDLKKYINALIDMTLEEEKAT